MKTKSRFWGFLIVYCLVLALVVVGMLCVLRQFLGTYEASRPEHTAEAFIQGLTAQDVCDGSDALLDTLDPALQTRQEAEQVILDALTEEFRAVKESTEENEIRYTICSGSRKIGTFRLVSREKTSFDFPVWTAEGESFDLSFLLGPETSITVPDRAKLTFLGKEVSRDYVIRSDIPFEMLREFPQEGMPQFSTYQVKGYLGEPSWMVSTQDGVEVAEQDYEDVFAGEDCEGAQAEALQARVEKFLDQYIAYCGSNKTTARGNLYAMKKSLVPDGQLFQRLYSALDGLSFGQSLRDKRGDTEIHCMKQIGEELYYVDVTYLVDTTGKRGVVQTTNNLKILLVPSGDTFLVSDICSY